jgi:Predicted transcriptional regulators
MLGQVLKEARSKAGLTQEQLAFKAGVDRTYLSELENDRKSPTLAMLFRIAETLGVSASALVARTERLMKRR